MTLKTECVGSFPSPVSQTVGLRIASNHRNGQLQKAHAYIYYIVPYVVSHIHTHPLLTRRMYTATHDRVYNIPTVGIYVAILSSVICKVAKFTV